MLAVRRVHVDEPAHGAEVRFECDEVLLGAVVQVALDPSPFGVGRGYDARSRGRSSCACR